MSEAKAATERRSARVPIYLRALDSSVCVCIGRVLALSILSGFVKVERRKDKWSKQVFPAERPGSDWTTANHVVQRPLFRVLLIPRPIQCGINFMF